MLRRIATALALASLIGPALARANEWEEDYTGGDWRDESPPAADDEYPVSVDVDAPPVNVETFQASLAPYGDWVVVGTYGRVWRPHVAAGWRPYYYGRWEWTSEGWLWASDEPFGWAAYHYGRWALDPGYGWVWVPGYQWAPAWVSWRYSGDVVGWAPLAPGVSVYVAATPFVESWWTFVPCERFVAEPVYRIAYEPARTRRYFFETAPAPARPAFHGGSGGPGRPVPAPAWGGPPPRAIEQRIGRPITPVRVVAAPSPGATRAGPGEVSIFRPGVRAGASVSRPAPAVAPRDAAPGRSAFRGDDLRPRSGVQAPVERPQDRGRGFGGVGGSAPAPAAPTRDRNLAPRGWGGPAAAQGAGSRPERPAPFAPTARAPRQQVAQPPAEPRREPPGARGGLEWHR